MHYPNFVLETFFTLCLAISRAFVMRFVGPASAFQVFREWSWSSEVVWFLSCFIPLTRLIVCLVSDHVSRRLGVRIPTLLISPWVPKGTVIGAPRPEEKPANNSEFSITSVIATVRKMLGGDSVSKPLTKRDAWSATFDGRLSETSPRTDCPMTLPDAPKSLGAAHARAEAMQPVNDLQKDILGAFRAVAGRDPATHPLPTLQGDAGAWLEGLVSQVLSGDHVLSRPTQQ